MAKTIAELRAMLGSTNTNERAIDKAIIDKLEELEASSSPDLSIYQLISNKDTDVLFAANSDTKYPSQKAAKTYIDTGLGTKQNSLGFTPENVANKDTDTTLAANSDTKYPSQKAIKAYADALLSTNTAGMANSGMSNVASFLYGACRYIKSGTSVLIFGQFVLTPTAGATKTELSLALPFAPVLGSMYYGGGGVWSNSLTPNAGTSFAPIGIAIATGVIALGFIVPDTNQGMGTFCMGYTSSS